MSKNIDKALAALEKRYGEPVAMKMSDSNTGIRAFSSGRPDLDVALGGGWAVGKIIEIFAPEATGKTGLALEAIASIQKNGGRAAFVDAEHALDLKYCKQIKVKVDELYICQPDNGEQGLEVVKALINTEEFDLIVVDSVTGLTPQAIIEGEVGEAKMGAHARLMGKGLASIKGIANKAECTVIFLNQLREKIVMFGNPETTTGGNALKFYAFQRLDIRKKGWIKEGETNIGFKQQLKVVKNKLGSPFQVVMNDIIYGKGVDDLTGLVDACIERNIIQKSGSHYSFEETKLGQGMKKLRAALEENPDLIDILKERLKE